MLTGVRAAVMAALILTIALVDASVRAAFPRETAGQDRQSAGSVPTPASVLGFEPCSDYKLATYEQIADYFRRLDAASDRMQLVEIGKTAEGRTQLMSIISSEANMKQLPRYQRIARSLALNQDEQGRPLGHERAAKLAEEGKAVIWIDFGLHATEVAHGQTAPWMAWKAVTEETDEMQFIRDNVIFILIPNMNPDGGTLVANWYTKHVGKPWEMTLPELYQKYVGHDNNRDWFMFNQPESRNIARQLYHEWFPQIVYNQHQSAPFPARIFVPPFEDPSNFNIPPLVLRGINAVGDAITRRLDQEGKVGAVSRLQFDTWWNGGMRTAPYFHNMVGILTETAHASATPADYDVKAFPKRFANGESTTDPSTYYPSPYLGGHWTMKMSCEYMNTASTAVLEMGAKRREEWLFDVYQMARDTMKAGAKETYLVPADQWDRGAAARMIEVLRLGGVYVERATAPFTADGTQYEAGSFVIRGAQPYLPYVRDLLTPQVYPDRRLYPGGPPEQPYDITGWTLNLQMGVTVDKIADAVTAQTEPVEQVSLEGDDTSAAAQGAYVIDPRTNDAFIAVNRLLKEGETVQRAAAPISVNGQQWPAGAFVVTAGEETQDRIAATAALGLSPAALDAMPQGELVSIDAPRIGLYGAWGGNMDEGWTRWLLEQYEFPYTTIRDKDIRAGDLGKRFDVIVLPDATYDSMLNGFAPGTMPDEYVGGMTPSGVANLYAFVAGGGTLVTLDSASELPLQTFGLPVRNALADLRENEFFCPGTILNVDVDNRHPVAWGMPDEAAAFFAESPAFDVGYPGRRSRGPKEDAPKQPSNVKVVASYAGEDLLMSGWLLGESYLHEKVAAVEATVEKGRVVMLGFRVQHRGQPHGTFKLLFNSLLLGGANGAEAATSSSHN